MVALDVLVFIHAEGKRMFILSQAIYSMMVRSSNSPKMQHRIVILCFLIDFREISSDLCLIFGFLSVSERRLTSSLLFWY